MCRWMDKKECNDNKLPLFIADDIVLHHSFSFSHLFFSLSSPLHSFSHHSNHTISGPMGFAGEMCVPRSWKILGKEKESSEWIVLRIHIKVRKGIIVVIVVLRLFSCLFAIEYLVLLYFSSSHFFTFHSLSPHPHYLNLSHTISSCLSFSLTHSHIHSLSSSPLLSFT